MNAPLNDEVRTRGGRERDYNRPAWEAQFIGAVASSSRPLKKDHPAASDAKEAVAILKQEAVRFPNWIFLTIVGRDGRTVRSTLSESLAVSRVNQTGGAIGLAGIMLLRDRLTTFVRPFISEDIKKLEKRLLAPIEDYKRKLPDFLRENARTL